MIAGGVCLLEQPNCLGTSILSGFCTVWSRFLGFQNVSVDGHSWRHPWLCCDICLCCAEVTHILIHVCCYQWKKSERKKRKKNGAPIDIHITCRFNNKCIERHVDSAWESQSVRDFTIFVGAGPIGGPLGAWSDDDCIRKVQEGRGQDVINQSPDTCVGKKKNGARRRSALTAGQVVQEGRRQDVINRPFVQEGTQYMYCHQCPKKNGAHRRAVCARRQGAGCHQSPL